MKKQELINTILFSNQINEKFEVDDSGRQFSSTAIFDRPSKEKEDIFELPITSAEIASNQLTKDLVSKEKLLDKNYQPQNIKELISAINSIFNDIDMTKDQISVTWKIIKKISEKVSNNEVN